MKSVELCPDVVARLEGRQRGVLSVVRSYWPQESWESSMVQSQGSWESSPGREFVKLANVGLRSERAATRREAEAMLCSQGLALSDTGKCCKVS